MGATLELLVRERARRNRRRRAGRQQTQPMSQPLIRESDEHEPRERKPESRVVRLAPIVDDALFAEVTPPRASSRDEASSGIPVQSGSRALLVAVVVAVSFAAGFGGGFIVGQRSRPSTESIDISHYESVAEPQPTRAAVEDPKPIASTTQTVAPISEEKVSGSEPIAATTTTVAPIFERAGIEFRADRRNRGTSTRGTCCRLWPSSRPLDAGRCRRGG